MIPHEGEELQLLSEGEELQLVRVCEGEELQPRLFYENKDLFKPINRWLSRVFEGREGTEGNASKSWINNLVPQEVYSFIKIRVDLAEIEGFLDNLDYAMSYSSHLGG